MSGSDRLDLTLRIHTLEAEISKLRPKPWLGILGPSVVGAIVSVSVFIIQTRYSEQERALVDERAKHERALAQDSEYLDRQEKMIEMMMSADTLDEITRAYTLFSSAAPPERHSDKWKRLLGAVVQIMADLIIGEPDPNAILRAKMAVDRTRPEIEAVLGEAGAKQVLASIAESPAIDARVEVAETTVKNVESLRLEQDNLWGQYIKGKDPKDPNEVSKKDLEHVFEVLGKACEAGVGQACGRMGLYHEAGWGRAKDDALAAQYYKNACALGNGYYCTRVK